MRQKKPYIKIDMNKENPLITIVKAGKIPVIRRDKNGFKNYDQESYFNAKKEELGVDVTNYPKTGCFCLLGGIFGNWVTGAHYKEPLNIGFIEPDTIVFSTYGYDKDCKWKYVPAKIRHMDAMREFITSYNCGVDTQYDTEDFEVSEEAIVDAKDITKVCTIDYDEYYKFINFGNDTMYSIFQKNNLFHTILYDLPVQFVKKYNVETLKDFHKRILLVDENDKDSYLEWYNSLENCIAEDIRNFVVNKDKSIAYHTMAFADAIKSYPLYNEKSRGAIGFGIIETYLSDTKYNESLIKLFPALDDIYAVKIRSTDSAFSIDFNFDSYFSKYTRIYHKQQSIHIRYYTHDRTFSINVKPKDGDSYEFDPTGPVPKELQCSILCFVELFNVYMNHFNKFFLIRPFDMYYRFNEILNKIHEIEDKNFMWKLSDDMESITYKAIINDDIYDVTYNFALHDEITEKATSLYL